MQAARKVVIRLRCQARLERLKRLASDIQAGRSIQESLGKLATTLHVHRTLFIKTLYDTIILSIVGSVTRVVMVQIQLFSDFQSSKGAYSGGAVFKFQISNL